MEFLNLRNRQNVFSSPIADPTFMIDLNITLKELNPDEHFIEQSHSMGLFTLANILDSRLDALTKKKAFSYSWYGDLLDLLKKHDLLGEFQKRQL